MHRSPAQLLPLALLLAACGGDDASLEGLADDTTGASTSSGGSSSDDTPVGDSEGSESSGGPEIDPNAPTYYADVAPILSEHCNGCHLAGGIAPFEFSTYETAVSFAPVIVSVTDAGTMPPWPPGGDSPALEHERKISAADAQTLSDWLDAGAPAGDPDEAAPLVPPETVELGSIDASGDIEVDYVPDESVSDDYRCFIIDPGIASEGILRGYQFKPGNGKIVHHVLSTLYGPESADALRAQDEAASGAGWSCGGGYNNIPGATAISSLGGWVPGVAATNYPVGTGVSVPAGALVVVQIHYNLAGGTDPDRTSLDLSMYPESESASVQQLKTVPMPWPLFKIPAGESNYVTSRALPASVWANNALPDDGIAYIRGVAAHMHLLGTAISVRLINDDGTKTLLEVPEWDFDWQGGYTLVDPIEIHADDRLEIECTYDNSDEHRQEQDMGPTVDVTWGEGTTDEMCLAYLQITDRPD